jgi:hypothetical protein
MATTPQGGPDPLETLGQRVLDETDRRIDDAVEDAVDDVTKDFKKIIKKRIEGAEEDILKKARAQATDDALLEVADSMEDESGARPGSSRVGYMGIWGTFFWNKLVLPFLSFLWFLFVAIILSIVYIITGFIRGTLWLVTLRWFLLIGILGWLGTTAFVANYDVLADTLRPVFQVLDDVPFRLVAPFINDFLELTIDKGCAFWNFLVELHWCVLRLFVDAFQTIIITQTALDQDFFDDNIWGTQWADFYDGNKRMMGKMMPSDPDAYLRTISLLHQRQLEYEDAIERNGSFVRSSIHRSFGSPFGSFTSGGATGATGEHDETFEETVRMFGKKRGVVTATKNGKTYRIPVPIIPRDFALHDVYQMQQGSGDQKAYGPAGQQDYRDPRARSTADPKGRASHLKYEAQFLTESLLGFQFGWDPEGDFPRVNISETSVAAVDGAVDFYVLMVTTLDDLTDMVGAGIEWFLTVIKEYTVEFVLQFFLNLICGDDEDCELVKNAERGDIHLRDELDDILDDLRSGDFTAFADLFEYLFLDDGVLTGWFVDAYEFMYTEIIRRLFQFVINILFQIPCLNFDSIGCFLTSILDCIFLLDLEVCLECSEACDPGCADTETCGEECLPFAKSCCDDNDPLVMECVESVCRAPFGDGLVAIFECFGRIILDVVGMFICPLMDILLIFLDFIIDVFNVVLDVFRSLNDFIEDDLAGVFEDIESFCDAIIRPDFCIDLPSPIPDACVDLDFDIPNDDNDNDLCSVISLTVDLGDVIIDPIQDVLEFLEEAFEDFEGEVDAFCDEYGNLGENLCLAVGLPESFCENLKDNPDLNKSIMKQALARRQQLREERRRGLSRANTVANNYDEMEWMAKYAENDEDAEWKEGQKMSADTDQEKWERRHHEYLRSKEHPIVKWYYRLTSEEYRVNKPTKQDFKDRILEQIRRDKISHLFYVAQNPFSTHTLSGGAYADNPRSQAHRRMMRKVFDKTFVIDPASKKRSIGLKDSKYKWDDDSEYAEAMRHLEGNVTGLFTNLLAMVGKIEWAPEEANFKYPERYEILGHMERMGTKNYLAGIGSSIFRYIRTYNEPNLINLDRAIRVEARRHTAASGGEKSSEHSEHEETMESGSGIPNPYEGAPSVRDRHLYATPEEKKAFRELAARYRWYRDTPSVHIGAHLKTMALVSFTSLIAPHMVDPVVNHLASRGPAFDAPLSKYLRHFGLTRHVHNITDQARQWRVRKLHQDELEPGELETIVTTSHPKAQATKDVPYPYDRLYNMEDYRADRQQGMDIIAGKKVDLDRVVMSRNPDGTPKRIRSNALAREMTRENIDYIHKALPFSMELSNPKLMPMTRTDTLMRNIVMQDRFSSGMQPRVGVGASISAITTIAGGAKTFIWPVVKIFLQNPQVALGVVYPVAISPLGQASLGLWGQWGLRRFDELFSDYLDFTPSGIEAVALDFAETLVFNIIYIVNFLEYILMGFILQLMMAIVIWVVLFFIWTIVLVICFPISYIWLLVSLMVGGAIMQMQSMSVFVFSFVGFIPPPPAVDPDGLPTQSPILGYPYDLIFCDSSEGTCSDSFDCRGGTFCDCPEHTLVDYRNFMFTVADTTPCEVPNSGTCLCWPQFKCNSRVPINSLADIFTPDCDGKFEYNFREQVYYASDGSFWDVFWTVVSASLTNFYVQFRFFMRSLMVGWLGFVERAVGAFIGIAVSMLLLIIVKRPLWFFAWTVAAIGLWYYPSAPGDFYLEYILPIFEDISAADITITTIGWIDHVINQFIDWLFIDTAFENIIDFFRFPNWSETEPFGSPDLAGGEVTCFVISVFSGFPGVMVLLVGFLALLLTFATGLFWLLVSVVIQFLWLLLLWLWAFVWLLWATIVRYELFKTMRKYITYKATNPRLRSIAKRLRDKIEYSGTAEYMAANSRASMNYWLPLPAPSRSKIHADLKKERKNARELRREMDELKRQIKGLQRQKVGRRRREDARAFPSTTSPAREIVEEGSSTSVYRGSSHEIPTVVPLFPSTGSVPTVRVERRWETDDDLKGKSKASPTGDVETGAGVGAGYARGLASTVTRGARGFHNLWQTIRPDADTTDKKLE